MVYNCINIRHRTPISLVTLGFQATSPLNKADKILLNPIDRFFNDFEFVIASGADDIESCLRARHKVYCEEFGYEPITCDGLETDHFDDYSIHCFVRHRTSGECAGTFRLVVPQHSEQYLPLEEGCPHAISDSDKKPRSYLAEKLCELSRLAMPARFRRQTKVTKCEEGDNADCCSDSNNVNAVNHSPILSMSLYFFAANVCVLNNIEHVYVMMEPKLARRLKLMGVTMDKLGNDINYHGIRAAYHIKPHAFIDQISPRLKPIQKRIMHALLGNMTFSSPVHVAAAGDLEEQRAKSRQAA